MIALVVASCGARKPAVSAYQTTTIQDDLLAYSKKYLGNPRSANVRHSSCELGYRLVRANRIGSASLSPGIRASGDLALVAESAEVTPGRRIVNGWCR